MKKLSLLAVLLGFNIALGACSDDETPDVKNELFQLPEKAYVLRLRKPAQTEKITEIFTRIL